MKLILIGYIFLILAGCSTSSMLMISSNAATYSATGKTNSDLAISMLLSKDCKIERVVRQVGSYCEIPIDNK